MDAGEDGSRTEEAVVGPKKEASVLKESGSDASEVSHFVPQAAALCRFLSCVFITELQFRPCSRLPHQPSPGIVAGAPSPSRQHDPECNFRPAGVAVRRDVRSCIGSPLVVSGLFYFLLPSRCPPFYVCTLVWGQSHCSSPEFLWREH